jgi:hypothetical protein
VGEPVPDAVVANDRDLGYARTMFDERSWQAFAEAALGVPPRPRWACRCGPAVTGGVQPMLPAAGLPNRLRPGLSRRPSSACAAARPGPPAGR